MDIPQRVYFDAKNIPALIEPSDKYRITSNGEKRGGGRVGRVETDVYSPVTIVVFVTMGCELNKR